jgi:phosphatidyl-myo-inositol alpha-mannosyltransferase
MTQSLPLRKILLTTPYDLAVRGGVNSQLWGLYRVLKERYGYQVRVIGPSSAPLKHKCPDLVVMGKTVSLPLNRARSNITLDIRIVPRVKALLKSFQPDIVHLQEPLIPLLNTCVLKYSNSINVGTYHTYSETSKGYDYARPILKWHHNRVHIRIAVSKAARRFVQKTFPGAYHIIPNAVELPSDFSSDQTAALEKSKKSILFIGRMDEPRKGFHSLLEATGLLEAEFPGRYQIMVAGSGRSRLKIRKRIPPLDIVWLGDISREKLDHALKSCDMVCAPSLGGESFGLVLLEAFAYGKPVVASDITGYREFSGNSGAALLVDPGNSRHLAQAMVKIFGDEQKYEKMSHAARILAQRFSWPVVAERIISLYDEAISGIQCRY